MAFRMKVRSGRRSGAPRYQEICIGLVDCHDRYGGGGVERAGEADGLRAEIKRRAIVEARDEPVPRPIAPRKLLWLSVGVASLLAVAATALYAALGNPTLPSVAYLP